MENRSDNNLQNSHAEVDTKQRKKRIRFTLALFIVVIIVVVAPRTCFGSEEFSKPVNRLEDEYKDLPKLWEFTEKLFKRLSCVESSLQDIKQFSACADVPASLVENMEFENRIRKPERDMSDQINTNNEELNVLKSMVQKLTDDVAEMQKEHKEFQTNVKILEEKLSKHSQFLKKKNAKVSRKMSQHGKRLHGLNISIELLNINLSSLNSYVGNLGSNLTILNMSIENHGSTLSSLNVSVENNGGTLRSVNANIEKIHRTLKGLNASVEAHGSTLSSLNASAENIRSTLSCLNVSVDTQGSTLNILNASVEAHGIILSSLNVSVESFGSTLSVLNASVETHGSTLSSLNVSVENNDGTLHSLNVNMENIRSTLKGLNESVEAHGSTLNSFNASVENIHTTVSSLNVSVENIRSTLSILNTSLETHCSTLRILNVSVENQGSSLRSLNVSVENRVTATEHHLLGQISANNKEMEALKDDVRKLNSSLEADVKTLEVKLGEQSQLADRKNAEVVKQIYDQKEALKELNVSVENLSSSFDGLRLFVEKLNSTLISHKMSVENRVDATERELSCQIKTNHKEIEALKDEVLKLNTKLETNAMTLEDKFDEQSQFAENRNAQLMEQISQHNKTLNGLNVSIANLGSTLSGLNVSVETLGCNISGLNASLDILHSNMKHLTENMTGISIETIVLDKRTEKIKENIFDKVSLTSVIMINTTLLVVVIIYLVANRKHITRHLSGNVYGDQTKVKPNPAPYSTAGRILSHVGEFPRLERKLCVISFYEETHPLHMNITQSVTQELNMDVVEFTIRRHDHILELPPVSLYFLFVDFNERNVILEDPTLGLGDLRLTTVQAIQKMGGRIIVFYVRDPNSRQLNPTQLYNEHLASVTRQQELSDLNRRSCFISAYDQLTDYQKAHLRRAVVQELNDR